MNLQESIPSRALTSSTSKTNKSEIDVVAVLYGVFKTLRADRLSRDAYTAALLSVDSEEPSLAKDPLLADPVGVAAAVFRGVVLHDKEHLPTSSSAWPPHRYGTGRTLWGSVKEAAEDVFSPPTNINKNVRIQASGLIAELMEEGGFLPSRDETRRVRTGAKNLLGQLLTHSETGRHDGSHEVVSIVKFVGDRHFTILRQIGDADAVGCEEVQEFRARNNAEVVAALGADEPSTLNVCLEFGMLRAHLIV